MFRWLALIVFLGAISVSAFYRRRARVQGETIPRRLEGPLLALGRALVALPLFGGVVLYVINPSWMAWASFGPPAWLRWLGVALGFLAVLAVDWILRTLGRNVSETVLTKSGHELVTGGPYRWIRHPLYTTAVLLFVALGLIAANAFILAFALVAMVAIRAMVVPLEERALVSKFGSEYENYARRTGAMLPRLWWGM